MILMSKKNSLCNFIGIQITVVKLFSLLRRNAKINSKGT